MHFDKSHIQWIDSKLLAPFAKVEHKIYLKHGGVSEGHFASLNASDSVGDDPYAVSSNRNLIKEDLGIQHLIFAKQQHGTNLVELTQKNLLHPPTCDGLFTKEKHIALAITHADCQAASIYDPKNDAIMVIHAGWRGLAQDIYLKMIKQFCNAVHGNPSDLVVCISPSLGPDHAEFKHFKEEFPQKYWSFEKEKFHLDLWEIAKYQLSESGIQEKNIEIMRVCTACEKEDYFSYRVSKDTGRNATCLALLE
jgi:polyphenol oxidase